MTIGDSTSLIKVSTTFSPVGVGAIVVAGILSLLLIFYMKYRMQKLKFKSFSAWPLSNKYFMIASVSGLVAITGMTASFILFATITRQDMKLIYFAGILSAIANAALWISLSGKFSFNRPVGVFAGLYRYERFAMIFRGTTRYRLLIAARFITMSFAAMSTVSYICQGLLSETPAKVFLVVYYVSSCLSAIWCASIDLALGVQVTFIIIESITPDRVPTSLKRKLVTILTVTVILDIVAVVLSLQDGSLSYEFGLVSILLAEIHVLITFHLLLIIQEDVKEASTSKETKSTSGRVYSVASFQAQDVDSVLYKSMDGSESELNQSGGPGTRENKGDSIEVLNQ